MNALADIYERFSPNAIGWTVLGLVGALSIIALILTVLTLGRAYFKPKPLVEDKLEKHSSVLADLQKSLVGLAPKEQLEELVNRLGTFATRDEFLVLEIIIQTFITRKEMEDRFGLFQKQIDDISLEWRNGMNELRGSIQELQNGNKADSELLHTLDERSKHANEKAETLSRNFDRLDTKIDRLIERSSPGAK